MIIQQLIYKESLKEQRINYKNICLFLFTWFIFSGNVNIISAQENPPYYSDTILTNPVPFAKDLVLGSAPSFTPDGRTVYTHHFTESTGHTINVSNFVEGKWTSSKVADFSGTYDELEPFISNDGSKLYFYSARPYNGNNIGGQIWFMERIDNNWSSPKPMDSPIRVQFYDSGVPSVSKNGTIYFGSNRRGRKWPWEIYYSKFVNGKYTQATNINDTINNGYLSWSHCIDPDENFLVFCSEKPGGYGNIDLYISFKENGKWTPAKNMGTRVNTGSGEVWPRLSPDGKYLFFNREGAEGNCIYQIDIKPILDSLRNISDVSETNFKTNLEFKLEQNYPNPFNPETVISYTIGTGQLPVNSQVRLKVYNVLGKEIAALIDGIKAPGNYEIKFDGRNLCSGIYFYNISAGHHTQSKKMVLMK